MRRSELRASGRKHFMWFLLFSTPLAQRSVLVHQRIASASVLIFLSASSGTLTAGGSSLETEEGSSVLCGKSTALEFEFQHSTVQHPTEEQEVTKAAMARPHIVPASGRTGSARSGSGPAPGSNSSGSNPAHFHSHSQSQSISHLPHHQYQPGTAPLLPGQMADRQFRSHAGTAPMSMHQQRPSLPHFNTTAAAPSSSLGRGVPRGSPSNSPRDANRPIRMTGRPLMHSPSTPSLSAAAAAAAAAGPGAGVGASRRYPTRPTPPAAMHTPTSSFSAAPGSAPGSAPPLSAPSPHFISRPGTSPGMGIYWPSQEPRPKAPATTTTTATAMPGSNATSAGTPARTLISSVARGQPKNPTSPEGATPIVALPLLDISPHVPARMGLVAEGTNRTPPLPRRVLADNFNSPRRLAQKELHQHAPAVIQSRTEQRQPPLALKQPEVFPGSPDSGLETVDSWSHPADTESGMALGLHTGNDFQAGSSSNSTLDVPQLPQTTLYDEDDDGSDTNSGVNNRPPRASFAPSLLHPSLSLAAAKALLPAGPTEDDLDDPTAGRLSATSPPAKPSKAAPSRTTASDQNRQQQQIPTPPPRGKSRPIQRKPAPTLTVNETAGVKGRTAGAQNAPLLGADWHMPVSSSSSSSLSGSGSGPSSQPAGPVAQTTEVRIVQPQRSGNSDGDARIEYGYATSTEAATYHAQEQKTPTGRKSILAPPALPAKDSRRHSPMKVQTELQAGTPSPPQPLAPSPAMNWLDVMTMPLAQSPASPSASGESTSYPLSVLSMKDDDGRHAPLTPEHQQGKFVLPSAARKRSSSVGSGVKLGTAKREDLFDLDTIEMLRALSMGMHKGDRDTYARVHTYVQEEDEVQPENSRCSSDIASRIASRMASPAVKLIALQMSTGDGPASGGRSGIVLPSAPSSVMAKTNGAAQAQVQNQTLAQRAVVPAVPSTPARHAPAETTAEAETTESPSRLMPMSVAEARAKAVVAATRLRQQSDEGKKHVKKAHSSGDLLNFASRQQKQENKTELRNAPPLVRQHTPAASEGKLLEQASLAARQEVVRAAERSELHHLRFLVSALAARLAAAESHMGLDLRHSLGDPRVDELIRRSATQLHLAAAGQTAGGPGLAPMGGVTSNGFFDHLARVTAEPAPVVVPSPSTNREDGTSAGAKVSGHVRGASSQSQVLTHRSSASSDMRSPAQQQQQQRQAGQSHDSSGHMIGEAWIALRRAKKARELASDATRSVDTLTGTHSVSSVQRSSSIASSNSAASPHRRTMSTSSARAPSSIEDAFYYSSSRVGSAMGVHNRVGALLGRSDSTSTSGSARENSGSSGWHSRTSSAAENRVMSPGSVRPSGPGMSPVPSTATNSTPVGHVHSATHSPVASIAQSTAPAGSVTSGSIGTRSAWNSFSTQATSLEEAGSVNGSSLSYSSGKAGSVGRSGSLGRSGSGSGSGRPRTAGSGAPQVPAPPSSTKTHHTARPVGPAFHTQHGLAQPHAQTASMPGQHGLGLDTTGFREGIPSAWSGTPDRTPSPSYAGYDGKFRFPSGSMAEDTAAAASETFADTCDTEMFSTMSFSDPPVRAQDGEAWGSHLPSLSDSQVSAGRGMLSSGYLRQNQSLMDPDRSMPAISEQSEGISSTRTSVFVPSAGR